LVDQSSVKEILDAGRETCKQAIQRAKGVSRDSCIVVKDTMDYSQRQAIMYGFDKLSKMEHITGLNIYVNAQSMILLDLYNLKDTLLASQAVVSCGCSSISGVKATVKGHAEDASIAFNDAYDTLRRKLSCQGIVINHNVDCLIDMAIDTYVDVKDSSNQEKFDYVSKTVDHFLIVLTLRSKAQAHWSTV